MADRISPPNEVPLRVDPPNAGPPIAGTPGADVFDWLLSPDDPSVRFLALTELLGEAAEGGAAATARREIMTQGAVPRILAAQNADGHWGGPGRFYTDKYRGTVWQLIVLAELGADPADARVRAACEAILRDSQEPESGGFSVECSKSRGGGLASGVIPCLTGNMVFSLVRLGYLDDPRLQRAVDWIATWQRFDDGESEPPKEGPYARYEMCWGRHTCHMGAVKALKGLAEIPPGRRSPAVAQTLAAGTEYILKHHVHKRSHDLSRDSKPGWRRLGYPLMYQTDVLEILGILATLGDDASEAADGDAAGAAAAGGDAVAAAHHGPLHDPRTREALDLVAGKQDAQGRWKLETTMNGKFVVDIEAKGKPSRWITLRALRVLRAAGYDARV